MDESRNFILDRIRSKPMSIEEFNFDALQGPTISQLFTPYDIANLRSIATSLKLSAKPTARYEAIDRIMRSKGFIKFGAGTNRVIYRHPEDTRFLVKVAADAIGMRDNPDELRQSNRFKPFIPKCFDISECGTVGIFERVIPITSREEFLSVADSIFEVITEWFVGEYVLADIGTEFFMNWGIRKGFGPVLLDFPYIYELDGNKLFCNKPDPESPTGKCEGVIDYDDGFNFLYCTKCRAKYKAKELAKKIKNKQIVLQNKELEGNKMQIKISGGSLASKKVINNESVTTKEEVRSIPTSSNGITISRVPVPKKKDKSPIIKNDKVVKPITEQISAPVDNKSNNSSRTISIDMDKIDLDIKNMVKKDEKKEIKKSVNGASAERKPSDSPIEFNEKYREEAKEEVKKQTPSNAVVEVENSLNNIRELIDVITISDVKITTVKNILMSSIDMMDENVGTMGLLSTIATILNNIIIVSTEENNLDIFSEDEVLDSIDSLKSTIDKLYKENIEKEIGHEIEIKDKDTSNLIDPDNIVLNIEYSGVTKYNDTDCIHLEVSADKVDADDNEDHLAYTDRMIPLATLTKFDSIIVNKEEYDKLVEISEKYKNTKDQEITAEETSHTTYDGISFYEGTVMNIKDIVSTVEDPQIIIVPKDNEGNFINDKDNNIITLYSIDNHNLNGIKIVSKDWLDGVVKNFELEKKKEDEEAVRNKTVVVNKDTEEEEVEKIAPEEVEVVEETKEN